MTNPIIEAFLKTTEESAETREANEMFISPEQEWLEYLDKGLIGFEYTEDQKIEARGFIEGRTRVWNRDTPGM